VTYGSTGNEVLESLGDLLDDYPSLFNDWETEFIEDLRKRPWFTLTYHQKNKAVELLGEKG